MSANETNFKHLSVLELHKVLNEKSHTLVDVRDQASFDGAHIPDAFHLSNESIGEFMRSADLDAPVVVCCYHGVSSQQAAQYLISQDFTDVYSLDGGFTEWQSQYPSDVEHS